MAKSAHCGMANRSNIVGLRLQPSARLRWEKRLAYKPRNLCWGKRLRLIKA